MATTRLAAAAAVLAATVARSAAAPVMFQNPLLNVNSPDPGVFYDTASSTYYAATTSGDAAAAFPIFSSNNLANWTQVGYVFPAGKWPTWAVQDMWAPEIHLVGSTYICYFVGRTKAGMLSVGAAVSVGGPAGPYKDAIGAPLVTNATYGMIDPTFFKDPATGKQYLIWKVDGNAIGKPTPILQAELAANGTALVSQPVQLITNTLPWEGILTEAPWMVAKGGFYYLFYSGNIYANYAIGVARAPAATGPFTKLGAPLVANQTGVAKPPYLGPGHCSVVETADGGWAMLYHVWLWQVNPTFDDPRYMSMSPVTWTASGWPAVAGAAPMPGPQPVP